jgi:hypothetical protein
LALEAATLLVNVRSTGVDRLQRDLTGLHGGLQKADQHANRTSRSLRALGGAAKFGGLALGAGLVVGAKASIDAFAEQERIAKQTTARLLSTGGAAKVTARDVERLAQSISRKSGIDDEAIQSAENLLLTFTKVRDEAGKGNAIFSRATQTIADFSVVFEKDLASSSILVGKALNDPIKGVTALSRAGVQFTVQQRDQIKTMVASGNTLGAQKLILGELATQTRGAATAAGNTFSGSIAKARNEVGNLGEIVGSKLTPMIGEGAKSLARFATEMQDGTGEGGRFVVKAKEIAGEAERIATPFFEAGKSVVQFFGHNAEARKLVLTLAAVAATAKVISFAGQITGITRLIGLYRGLTTAATVANAAQAGGGIGGGKGKAASAAGGAASSGAAAAGGGLLARAGPYAAALATGAFIFHETGADKFLLDLVKVKGVLGEVTSEAWRTRAAMRGALIAAPGEVKALGTVLRTDGVRNVEAFSRALALIPSKKRIEVLAESTEAKQQLADLSGRVRRIAGERTLVRILTDAPNAGAAIKAMNAVLRGVPPSKVLKILHNAPNSKDAVKRLDKAVRDLPRNRRISISTPGLDESLRNIDRLKVRMDALIAAHAITTLTLTPPPTKRKGGLVERFAGGGLVEALMSPGEALRFPGGGWGVVPGQPTAADNVLMGVPHGTEVFTGHGQAMLAAGASRGAALAMQAPHFAKGGTVKYRNVGASWYGDGHGHDDPYTKGDSGYRGDHLNNIKWAFAELGMGTSLGGLGRGSKLVVKRGGRAAVAGKYDIGPGYGDRQIDLWNDLAHYLNFFGVGKGPVQIATAPRNLKLGPVNPLTLAATGGSTRATTRTVPNVLTTPLSELRKSPGDPLGEGFAARIGGDPLFFDYTGRRTSLLSTLSEGIGQPASYRTINIPGSRGSSKAKSVARGSAGAWSPGKPSMPFYDYLKRRYGLTTTSSYRTPAHNRAVGGVPNSRHTHGSMSNPGAMDFLPPSSAAAGYARSHGASEVLIHNAGSGLHLHVGLFRRGGVVGRVAASAAKTASAVRRAAAPKAKGPERTRVAADIGRAPVPVLTRVNKILVGIGRIGATSAQVKWAKAQVEALARLLENPRLTIPQLQGAKRRAEAVIARLRLSGGNAKGKEVAEISALRAAIGVIDAEIGARLAAPVAASTTAIEGFDAAEGAVDTASVIAAADEATSQGLARGTAGFANFVNKRAPVIARERADALGNTAIAALGTQRAELVKGRTEAARLKRPDIVKQFDTAITALDARVGVERAGLISRSNEAALAGSTDTGTDTGSNDAVAENNRLLVEHNALLAQVASNQQALLNVSQTQGPALISAVVAAVNGEIGGRIGLGLASAGTPGRLSRM